MSITAGRARSTASTAVATNGPALARLAEVGGVAQEDAQRRGGGDAADPRGAGRVHAAYGPHVLLRDSG
jgi:hypothetical protein